MVKCGTLMVVVMVWIEAPEEDSRVVVRSGQVMVGVKVNGYGGRTSIQGGLHDIEGFPDVQIEGLTFMMEGEAPLPLPPPA